MKNRRMMVWLFLLSAVLFCSGCMGGQRAAFRETAVAGKASILMQESQKQAESVAKKILEPEIVEFTISAAGDVTLGNAQVQGYEGTFREMYDKKQDPGYFLQNVKAVFAADDMTIVNFEGTLTFSNDRVEKAFNMKGDPEYVSILTAGSVEVVSLGNNHHMDYGQKGHDDTVAALEGAGIPYAFDNQVGYYEEKGVKVGFVSVNEVYDGKKVETYLEEGISRLRAEGMDLVIACCHWGIERNHNIEAYQQELGRKCIDWGADLVLGHHPHVLQGIECYNGKYIVYSLGNFCFGGNTNPANKDSMIFQQTFTFVNGKKREDANIKIIPCSVSSVECRNDYQPTLAVGAEAERILKLVDQYSENLY